MPIHDQSWKSILNAVLPFARPVLSLVGFTVYSSLKGVVKMPTNLEMMQKLWHVC